jgi:hypothetical protein
VTEGRIIAVALLTEEELDRLGGTFTRVWPIDEVAGFDELLAAIDEADGAQPIVVRSEMTTKEG